MAPVLQTHSVSAGALRWTILVASLLLHGAPWPAEAASPAVRSCKQGCGQAKKLCVQQVKAKLDALRAECTGGEAALRQCRRQAKVIVRPDKAACVTFVADCRACCGADGADCAARCGDERVSAPHGEECDPPRTACASGGRCDDACHCLALTASSSSTTTSSTSSTSTPGTASTSTTARSTTTTTSVPNVCGNGLIEGTEQCEPPGSGCGSGGACDAFCHCRPSSIGVEWTLPAPSTAASGEAFPLKLRVSGSFAQVEGGFYSCQSDVPPSECLENVFATSPQSFSGPPGTFDFVTRGVACGGEDDYYLVASFSVHDGATTLGPFASSLTTTHMLAPTTAFLYPFPSALTFNVLTGHKPGSHLLSIYTVCGDSIDWQLAADVPWLHLDSTSGVSSQFQPGYVSVRVDATGLDPGAGPFTGMLTLSSPQAAAAVEVPVTLNVFPDVDARWTTPAPSSVASGKSFPLRLEVAGDFTQVRGQVLACPSGVSVDRCYDQGAFAIEPGYSASGLSFSGPPGSFDFVATGIDCQAPNDYYLAAWYIINEGDDSFGPFLTSVTTTRLLARSTPILQARLFFDALPSEMRFSALEGQSPPGQRLKISSVCGEPIDWVVAGSTPWLRGVPASGATDASISSSIVQVDATHLEAAAAPFTGELTVSSPQASNAVHIPVTVDVLGGISARWTVAAPGSIASGKDVPLSLAVAGAFDELNGQILACRSDETVNDCVVGRNTFAIEPLDLSGPPGTFDIVANGIDCQGPNDYYLVASLFFRTGHVSVGPFYSPPTTTRLLGPTAPILAVSPSELEFHTLPGENPSPRAITIGTVCGETVSWSIASDAPWVRGEPASGTADSTGTLSAVTVDVTNVHSGELLNGMLTVSSPQAEDAVPVFVGLRIFTGNAVVP